MNSRLMGRFRLRTGGATGKTAVKCCTHFPLSMIFATTTGPCVQGVFVLCGAWGLFAGTVAC